ncbi:zinc finger-containing ubiquitin peptidase 1 isoform X1 [Synchiropus splendidus]|uniref:zinc finger-containing ubiquitin peptidase 1 isoform X1 n=1 Tax=Synchiropus splendidus TaxID=270530 RepID=UPI00237E4C02|nr:zinc finger-containing ubiquitin peptidase 1 isoform X1 [Synchiropus splendidus]
MLTCEICGEELLLEEDLKTHLLLSHEENDMDCPLCSLSGVSYDELCHHINFAHPEKPQRLPEETFTPTSARTSSVSRDKPSTSQFNCDPCGVQAEQVQPRERASVADSSVATSVPWTQTESSNHFMKARHRSPKQRRLSLPGDGGESLTCPICASVCSNSSLLQEHVELHLESEDLCPNSDLKLARKLQQEENLRHREDEDQKEKEEFKKLQKQFGLDGSGSYRKQMERTMERDVARGLMDPAEYHCRRAEMLESLVSGLDDGKTKTQGVIRCLHDYYRTEGRDCVHVWLSADTDHYCSSAGDKGWGCGYRNFQMLLSSLSRIDAYVAVAQGGSVPSIPRLQSMMEEAWKEGLDPQGASHFNHRLQGTRAWIGATEVYVLLTSLGIRARIVDFHQPTGPGGTHPRLFDWVKQYYCQTTKGSNRLPSRINCTSLPPLYLQHQGHSRSIVGLEQRKNGSLCLLLFDPGASTADTRKLMNVSTVSTAVRNLRKLPGSMKQKQYQVVSVEGVLTAEDKQVSDTSQNHIGLRDSLRN